MASRNIAVIGSGYVGLVTGACFAELGNKVICVDNNKEKISDLTNNKIPIYEPGLDNLVKRNYKEGRLFFTTDIKKAARESEIIFICVGTPPKENGEPDLSAVGNVAKEIASVSDKYKVIVEKSTVPVQTAKWLKSIISNMKSEFDIAVNPEFLREGSAVYDFMNPDRIVIGAENSRAYSLLSEIYKPLNAPILFTDINSAELIKHLSNAMLAQKISTINLIALLCEKTNADIETVAKGVGMDKRIGTNFLKAGIGYGGFCFPKDLDALIHILRKNSINSGLFEQVQKINKNMRKHFVFKIEKSLGTLKGKKVAILGLAFKANTDDMRLAPSIEIIEKMKERGAIIKAYDPKAMEVAKGIFKDIEYCKNPYDAAKDADALVILTDWPEFKDLDLTVIKEKLKGNIIIDGRNIFNKERMKKLGFKYLSVGR
ncbi:MAG: UDP-glucose/GDP-mannose dehydrogenase family protein [archaeon]